MTCNFMEKHLQGQEHCHEERIKQLPDHFKESNVHFECMKCLFGHFIQNRHFSRLPCQLGQKNMPTAPLQMR